MTFILKQFDVPLLRFTVEKDLALPRLTIQWVNDERREFPAYLSLLSRHHQPRCFLHVWNRQVEGETIEMESIRGYTTGVGSDRRQYWGLAGNEDLASQDSAQEIQIWSTPDSDNSDFTFNIHI